jgi:predicted RNase H-like HicB family nuclease
MLEKIKVFCVIEKADGEYLAYCDELRATASGDTEEEALNNLKAAIKELINYQGLNIFDPNKKRIFVEVV